LYEGIRKEISQAVIKMYPKTLTKEEMTEWIDKSKLPLRMIVTQISEDTIVFQRIK